MRVCARDGERRWCCTGASLQAHQIACLELDSVSDGQAFLCIM